MMILIAVAALLILLSDLIKSKIGENTKILNLLIALLPVFLSTHYISENSKYIISGILLLNYSKCSSRTQSLLMLIALNLEQLGLTWNDTVLLVFLTSFFDRFHRISGIEKLLLILGSAAIYTGFDILAVIFIYLNSLYSKNQKIELSIFSCILIFSSFNFLEMSERVSYLNNFVYFFTLLFLTSRENILVVVVSFFMISFAHLQFEHTISFSYTALAMVILTEFIQYLTARFGDKISWLSIRLRKEDVIYIICLLGMSYKWNISLVYIFTSAVITIYSLDRFQYIDYKDLSVRKTTVLILFVALVVLQPWSFGFNFFGFHKILGQNLLTTNVYLPLAFLVLIFGLVYFLYTRLGVPERVKGVMFKINLKNLYRLNFIIQSVSSCFIVPSVNRNKSRQNRFYVYRYIDNENMFKHLIILSLLFVLLCTIKVVIEL